MCYNIGNGVEIGEDSRLQRRSSGATIQDGETLKIPRKIIENMVKEVSKDIKIHVVKTLTKCKLNGKIFIYLVGGFSNSRIVREDIKTLENVDTYWPQESELAVMRGAVIFGWKPGHRAHLAGRHPESLPWKAVFQGLLVAE